MKERPRTEAFKPYVPSPLKFPEGFILLQDTREQRPLFPRPPKGLVMMSTTLKDGDYSIKGFESNICFERKGIGDLWPYCSTERDKTKRKMDRFKSMDFVGMVIEAKEHEVFQFQQFTKVHPECIRGALISFAVRYRVHIYFGTRELCARWLLERAIKYWNIQHEV